MEQQERLVRASDLKGTTELAALFKVGRSAVSNWATRRASTRFPEPVADLSMGPVYDLSEVLEWKQTHRHEINQEAA